MKKTVVTFAIMAILILVAHAGKVIIEAAVEISWESISGDHYQVQYSTNLSSGVWIDLGDPIVSVGSTSHIFDSTRSNSTKYYRVRDIPGDYLNGLWHFHSEETDSTFETLFTNDYTVTLSQTYDSFLFGSIPGSIDDQGHVEWTQAPEIHSGTISSDTNSMSGWFMGDDGQYLWSGYWTMTRM